MACLTQPPPTHSFGPLTSRAISRTLLCLCFALKGASVADSPQPDDAPDSGEPGTRSRVEQLLREAMALPTDERRAFLEENCGSMLRSPVRT